MSGEGRKANRIVNKDVAEDILEGKSSGAARSWRRYKLPRQKVQHG